MDTSLHKLRQFALSLAREKKAHTPASILTLSMVPSVSVLMGFDYTQVDEKSALSLPKKKQSLNGVVVALNLIQQVPAHVIFAGSTLISICQTDVDRLLIRTQSKGQGQGQGCCYIYSNQTIHYQQILEGVEVKVMHCRSHAPRSIATRTILQFFSLKIEETQTFMNRNFKRQRNFM